MAKDLMIGDLARLTATKVNTIRFYEEAGLMPRAMRTHSGRRVYSIPDVERLAFIRHARSLGFSTEKVQSLLALADHPDTDCGTAQQLAAEHLIDVRDKISKLSALEGKLSEIVAEGCESGPASNCRVLEALGCDVTA